MTLSLVLLKEVNHYLIYGTKKTDHWRANG